PLTFWSRLSKVALQASPLRSILNTSRKSAAPTLSVPSHKPSMVGVPVRTVSDTGNAATWIVLNKAAAQPASTGMIAFMSQLPLFFQSLVQQQRIDNRPQGYREQSDEAPQKRRAQKHGHEADQAKPKEQPGCQPMRAIPDC